VAWAVWGAAVFAGQGLDESFVREAGLKPGCHKGESASGDHQLNQVAKGGAG